MILRNSRNSELLPIDPEIEATCRKNNAKRKAEIPDNRAHGDVVQDQDTEAAPRVNMQDITRPVIGT